MCALRRSYYVWVVLVAGVSLTAGAGPARAGTVDGGALYRKYCASCHGVTGRGDGPDAAAFSAPPRNLHEGFLKRYTTKDLARRVREGQPLELALDLGALRAHAAQVEDLVVHLKRLPATDWRRVEAGWAIFAARCEVCHGPTGKPGTTLPAGVRTPRDLSDPAVQRSLKDDELTQLVRHGRQGMPALTPRVRAEDGPVLTAFVRLLSPGFVLYSRYCANCHGDDGRGRSSLGEVIRLPTVMFDRAYFSRRDPEQVRQAVWHMVGEHEPTMPHYRSTLSAAQARAIVEHLKRSE